MKSFRLFSLVSVLALLSILTSCGKNEFSVSFNIKDGGNRSLIVVYTAWSDKQDELRKEKIPLQNGAFNMLCATKHPTILWVLGHDGKLLHAVYAEKGDKIEITGAYTSPLEWRIKGNEVSERYSGWMASNVALLSGGNPKQVNDAVAKYVRANPDDMASALMLLTIYYRSADSAGFDALWKSLDIDDKEKERLRHVALAEMGEMDKNASKVTVSPLTLRCRADSLVTVNPASGRATMLYFWRRSDGPHKGILRVLSSQPSDVQVADIYLDPDTVQWRYLTERDTFARRQPLWAFGGEMNISLSKLAIPSAPYIIVADRKGKQLYRGESPSEASAAAAKAK